MQMIDHGAALTSGMRVVPEYAEQQQKQLLNQIAELQLASGRQDMAFAAQKSQREQQRQSDYLTAVSALGANPTYEQYRDIQLRFPEQHQALSGIAKAADENRRDVSTRLTADIVGLARNGRWDLAAKKGNDWLATEVAAGQATDDDAVIIDMLRDGSPEERNQVLGILTHRLATSAGADQTAEMWNAVMDESRDRERQPFLVRKDAAEAVTAEAEADSAPSYFAGRAREQIADAGIAESNSAWQELKNAATVSKSKAQLGNIRSMIAKRAAATGKPIEEVTVGEVRTFIGKKRSKGGLSPTERAVDAVLSPKPAPKSPPKPTPSRSAAPAPIIVNPKTGERKTLRNGKWVTIP